MAEELQSLLEKIYTDGVEKARAGEKEILARAEAQAKEIVAAAKLQADKLRADAAAEAEKLQLRAESAISQAARDIIFKLKDELEGRLRAAISGASGEALTPQFMAEIVKTLAEKLAEDPEAEISVLCAVKDEAELAEKLTAALRDSFRTAPKVFADSGIDGGLEVSFRDGEYFFDFTIPALTELLGKYTNERVAKLLAGQQ